MLRVRSKKSCAGVALTHMCTPAFPKPIPAMEAAILDISRVDWQKGDPTYSISPLYSWLSGSLAIFGNQWIVCSKAHLAKMSESGLDPWYEASISVFSVFAIFDIRL